MTKHAHKLTALALSGVLSLSLLAGCANAPSASPPVPTPSPSQTAGPEVPDGALVLADQGIFSAGGITTTSEGVFDPENQWEETGAGQTAHVDHANVLYQIPAEETGLPMVFLHGYGQSRMGWMTTPDGREGWSDLFLRMGHSVWLIDEPRRGEAGATSVAGIISTKTLDQRWYTQFRIGRWEDGQSVANEGSQFPNDPESVDQFFRQMTPDTGMSSDMGGDFDNEDESRVYGAGYSAGGETMSRAVSMRPDLYAAYLHGASQWDGTYGPVAEEQVAVYIFMAENDEYYGSQKARDAYDGLYAAYQERGLSDGEIQPLLQAETPDNAWFRTRGIQGNYHGGGNVLFDEQRILDWIVSQRKPQGADKPNTDASLDRCFPASPCSHKTLYLSSHFPHNFPLA